MTQVQIKGKIIPDEKLGNKVIWNRKYPDDFINKVVEGDCLEVMKEIPDNSIDTLITDPPYGLSFMGKDWDNFKLRHNTKSQVVLNLGAGMRQTTKDENLNFMYWTQDWATEALRVLKPGGTALVFAGSRTQHLVAMGFELAGWILKDTIMWLYGSGFPKATDISKQLDRATDTKYSNSFTRRAGPSGNKKCDKCGKWLQSGSPCKCPRPQDEPINLEAKLWNGWKSHGLKPAYEPILVAVKPNDGTYANNALKWGVSGLNIDGARVGLEQMGGGTMPDLRDVGRMSKESIGIDKLSFGQTSNAKRKEYNEIKTGRFPANLILECICDGVVEKEETIQVHTNPECPCYLLDEQSGMSKSSNAIRKNNGKLDDKTFGKYGAINTGGFVDKGGASRFFYTAKASKSERLLNGFYCAKLDIWENKDENMEQAVLLARAILDLVPMSLSIGGYGNNTTEAYPKECLSTIKTEIKKITELKTWNLLMLQPTKDYIVDVFGKKMDGGNHAQSAGQLKEWMTKIGILQERVGLVTTDVKNATYKLLLKLKEEKSWIKTYSNHPTHKPLKLMEYLCTLTKTPTSGIVLDPFAGSGTTGMACKNTGRDFILIEKESEYCKIAEARINSLPNKLF